MAGLIGLILLITAWTRYRYPLQFLTLNALACIFLSKDALNHGAGYLFWANIIILSITVYQIGQKQRKKI